MRSRLFAMVALLLVLHLSQSAGQVPHTLSYQGILTDSAGHAKGDGTYSFAFRLYSSPSGGAALWSETKTLTVSQGLFNTLLGDQVPLVLPFDAPYWLSIQVAADPELSPRIPLTAAGYSLYSLKSDTALYAKNSPVQTGQVVRSVNTLKDSVTLAPGNNITITPSGHTLTIAAASGFQLPYTSTTSKASTLLSLTNTGAGGAASFTIANGADTSAALRVSTNGFGTGIIGSSLSSSGIYGETNANHDTVAAIRGVATSTSAGVYGVSGDAAASIYGTGVRGIGGQAGGTFKGGTWGVFGTSETGVGVEGVTNAAYDGATGILGVAVPGSGQIIGVRGAAGNSTGGIGVQGEGQYRGVLGMASGGGGYGVSAEAYGSDGVGLHAFANNGSNSYAIIAQSFNGWALSVNGKFYQYGALFEAHPTSTIWSTNKPATVKLNDGSKVKLFSEEAAEVLFNDYGEGTLQGGKAHIDLDPTFAQTVTIDKTHPMKVFVQLEGDCKGVYVTNKTTSGFDVVELQGGASNAHFSYRIACKRKYYEDERLATDEQDIKFNERVLQTAWPEVVARENAIKVKVEQELRERPKNPADPLNSSAKR